MGYDFLIVGAGFAGSVMAERIASRLGKRVLVIDRRARFVDGSGVHDLVVVDRDPPVGVSKVTEVDAQAHVDERVVEHPLEHPRVPVARHPLEAIGEVAVVVIGARRDSRDFDARFGPLPYRSLEFRFETLPVEWAQRTGTVNEPDESVPFTRTTEFKHLTGQQHASTTIVREFPRAEGEPYYPIPCPENERLYRRYQALAEATRGVHFVGRLATYRYYNMDQVVGQALATFKRLAERSARAA